MAYFTSIKLKSWGNSSLACNLAFNLSSATNISYSKAINPGIPPLNIKFGPCGHHQRKQYLLFKRMKMIVQFYTYNNILWECERWDNKVRKVWKDMRVNVIHILNVNNRSTSSTNKRKEQRCHHQ